MGRQELLTKLAMELAEWPSVVTIKKHHEGWDWENGDFYPHLVSHDHKHLITRNDWLAERERLIAKPSWDQAPEWAQWLAQDKDGEWWWFKSRPQRNGICWYRSQTEKAASGERPAGHDWRKTLERRPEAKPEAPEWDGGLPPVGERVLIEQSGVPAQPGTICYISGNVVVWQWDEMVGTDRSCAAYHDCGRISFRPIRSEEEKQVEAMESDLAGILPFCEYTDKQIKELAAILYAQGYRKP